MTEESDLRDFDRSLHATQARFSGGVSPAALALAAADWAMHLAGQPGRQAALARQLGADWAALTRQTLGLPVDKRVPEPGDHRFAAPGWSQGPAALAVQAFLRAERFWDMATTGIPGVSKENERIVNFLVRQSMDMVAPAMKIRNFNFTESTKF